MAGRSLDDRGRQRPDRGDLIMNDATGAARRPLHDHGVVASSGWSAGNLLNGAVFPGDPNANFNQTNVAPATFFQQPNQYAFGLNSYQPQPAQNNGFQFPMAPMDGFPGPMAYPSIPGPAMEGGGTQPI
ncbi:hypothetical protein HWV62_5453 [Athelia sp. TMB]|nr:hypothetical protein HWV62_5453 [Athelia sp. TMB]